MTSFVVTEIDMEGEVACYIRNDLGSNDKSDFSNVMEIFFLIIIIEN